MIQQILKVTKRIEVPFECYKHDFMNYMTLHQEHVLAMKLMEKAWRHCIDAQLHAQMNGLEYEPSIESAVSNEGVISFMYKGKEYNLDLSFRGGRETVPDSRESRREQQTRHFYVDEIAVLREILNDMGISEE